MRKKTLYYSNAQERFEAIAKVAVSTSPEVLRQRIAASKKVKELAKRQAKAVCENLQSC